jgi:hypothetical protein
MTNFRTNTTRYTVYDDKKANELLTQLRADNDFFGGYVPRDFDREPFGTYAAPYGEPLIDRSEWAERAEVAEVGRATPEHLASFAHVPILNQGQRPYCWCYGACGAMMTAYAVAGLSVPHLSATSAAAKIKGYRDVGGWAGEAIQGIEKYGVSTLDYWPEAVLDRKYDTAEQRANAKLHAAAEFSELPSQNFDAVASALLHGFPVTLGLAWWGHLVYATKLVVLGRGSFGVLIRNSWGDKWETKGATVLTESRATPHEAFAIRSVTKYDAPKP